MSLRIGLIGAGRIGRVHAQTIAWRLPEAKIVAIADRQLLAAEALGAAVGVTVIEEDFRRVVTRPDIDAVLVCSSTDTHAST